MKIPCVQLRFDRAFGPHLKRLIDLCRHRRPIASLFAVLGVLSLPALASPAAGLDLRPADGRPLFQLELATSSLGAEGLDNAEQSVILRGSRNVGRRWSFEAALARFSADDVWLTEFSSKLYLHAGRRRAFYLLAGPGLIRLGPVDETETLVHLGLGTELSFGRRFYLRPELKARKFLDDLDVTTLYEMSLGFGWRMGG